jgi:anti-anti-sigma regulatory factor
VSFTIITNIFDYGNVALAHILLISRHLYQMKVKIDTKEKFHVITPLEAYLPANLTDNMRDMMHGFLERSVKNVVFNASGVEKVDKEIADCIADIQQLFYEQNASFVICCLRPELETMLEDEGYLESMNTTPTESEAWDIVQMEEIERELLGDETDE